MSKITETKYVLNLILPSVLIEIINSYYNPFELIKKTVLYPSSDYITIIDNSICVYYTLRCRNNNTIDYKTIFDFDQPNNIFHIVRTYDYKYCVISFKERISLSNVYDISNIKINISDTHDDKQQLCIGYTNVSTYLPEFTKTQYIIDYKLYNKELFECT
jgi:hypothetical protein